MSLSFFNQQSSSSFLPVMWKKAPMSPLSSLILLHVVLLSGWRPDPPTKIRLTYWPWSNILKDWKSTSTIELICLKPTLQFIGNKYFYERQSWTIWDSSLALWTAWLACGFIVHHHVSHLVGHLVNLQMLGHLHIVQPSPIKCSATEIFS